MAYRSAAVWIDQSLAHVAEAVERMPDDRFLAEHHPHTMSPARRLSTWLPPCSSASGGAGGLKVATHETPVQFNPRDVLQSWGDRSFTKRSAASTAVRILLRSARFSASISSVR
ncbi:hypothetical protein MES5069_300003 [Mesorhizobium escarrei]|uniref:Uncharacterized protein n=1 Tax=Mesorhizobium escarrei TaxID=666018 RepID=A0ABM9DZK7_9HYPH|nr:hypothetical protein MES5069_300003 [Mesorhizobium escarrei]